MSYVVFDPQEIIGLKIFSTKLEFTGENVPCILRWKK